MTDARPVASSGRPLSETGREYHLSAVGFVDTLGAKALSESEVFMNALAYMVSLQKEISLQPHKTIAVRTTYFSDNIGASIVIENLDAANQKKAVQKLLRLLAVIQVHYLSRSGILCRGGVAIGDCFHDDNVIFGPALVAAYLLELTAETPRIVVTDAVVDLAGDTTVPLFTAEPLRSQGDGTAELLRSIDFIRAELPSSAKSRNVYIAQLEAMIKTGLADAPNAGVKQKWQWTSDKVAAVKDELAKP